MLLVFDGKFVGARHTIFVSVRVEEDPGAIVVGYGDAFGCGDADAMVGLTR